MHTYTDWRRHYELPDNAETRREYAEYVEALQALRAASERKGVSA